MHNFFIKSNSHKVCMYNLMLIENSNLNDFVKTLHQLLKTPKCKTISNFMHRILSEVFCHIPGCKVMDGEVSTRCSFFVIKSIVYSLNLLQADFFHVWTSHAHVHPPFPYQHLIVSVSNFQIGSDQRSQEYAN